MKPSLRFSAVERMDPNALVLVWHGSGLLRGVCPIDVLRKAH